MEMCGRREKQRRLRKKRRTGGDREIRRKQMAEKGKELEVKAWKSSASEWHSNVSSASDSRWGEQVLNIKESQQRTWANGPYWYGTSQAGTDVHIHTPTHTCTRRYRDTKSSIRPQWQSKAERTCMFNSQPSISACSCSYTLWPSAPPSTHTHTHMWK